MPGDIETENPSKEYLHFGNNPEEVAYKLFTQACGVLLRNKFFQEAASKAFLDKDEKLTFDSGNSQYTIHINSNNKKLPLWDSMTISKSQGSKLLQMVQFSFMYDDWDKRRFSRNELPLLTFQDSRDEKGVQFDAFLKVDNFIQELAKDLY